MKKNNKGFTLVELIVVLVILAILAAILVPALLGYIDKARQGQYAEEAHSILVAAQANATERYASKKQPATKIADIKDYINPIVDPTEVTLGTIVYKNPSWATGGTDHAMYTVSEIKDLEFTSQNNSKVKCSFDGSEWIIQEIDGKTVSP